MFFYCKKASFQHKIKLFSLIKRNFLLQPIISSSFQPGIRPLPPLPTYKLQMQKQKQETEIKPSLPVNLNLHCHRCTVIFKIFWGENLRGGGPLFLCFIVFLWTNFQFYWVGTWVAPAPLLPHLCSLSIIDRVLYNPHPRSIIEKLNNKK